MSPHAEVTVAARASAGMGGRTDREDPRPAWCKEDVAEEPRVRDP